MVTDFYATKLGMTQAWTTSGKRLAITRCKAEDLPIISSTPVSVTPSSSNPQNKQDETILEVGLGKRKLDNMKKPLKTKVSKSGFSFGVKKIKGIRLGEVADDQADNYKPGTTIKLDQVLSVGDVVQVQGISKGRGFAGGIKRHGFNGGPKTHGQSDRERAVGSIGSGTYPGKVWKGKKMPGHYGAETKTVKNLVVVHIDQANNEVWLSGPVPGHTASHLKISKLNQSKHLDLDKAASQIPEPKQEEKDEATDIAKSETSSPEKEQVESKE